MSQPLVAIVGAPNVGKSTLFNRLVGRRNAIVTHEPGTTRDRLYGMARTDGRQFRVVDTGGLTPESKIPYAREIEAQARMALGEAAVVLFVIDIRAGVTGLDREVASLLRHTGLPIVPVANKVDSPAQDVAVHEMQVLGLGDPVAISAEHDRGIDLLLEALDAVLAQDEPERTPASDPETPPLRVAIIGRPNAGKSSILNRLLGEERVLVSAMPGTTRDAVDTLLRRDGRLYLLIDTAGIRRRGRASGSAETLAVIHARKSIERSDVVVLVVDATQGLAAQDTHIAGYAFDCFRPILIAVNKWDLVESREGAAKSWEKEVRQRLRFVKEFPIAFVSAKSGLRTSKLLDHADALYEAGGRLVSTPELNRWLQAEAASERSAPARGGSIKLFYATQTGVHPPSFVLFCNDARKIHFSLRRHLDNSLRERFGFGPAPIHLRFRSRRTRKLP